MDTKPINLNCKNFMLLCINIIYLQLILRYKYLHLDKKGLLYMEKSLKISKKYYYLMFILIILILGSFLLFNIGKFNIKNNDIGQKKYFNEGKEEFKCEDCNVILISITNLRNDHLGYNGYFRDTSPNIDNFASESIVFENAFTQASWTLPVGISFFTSLYPFSHKIMNRESGITSLSSDIVALPDILKRHGYVTAAFTGGFDYNTSYGLTSRFDEYVHSELNRNFSNSTVKHNILRYGNFEKNMPGTVEWLREHKDDKFMLFFQGFNAHCPFAYPTENKIFDPDYESSVDFYDCLWTFEKVEPVVIGKKSYFNVLTPYVEGIGFGIERLAEEDIDHMVALYDGEIQNVDSILQELFEEVRILGLYNNTIVVLFSEHGDLFGEHGRFMRGGPLRGTFYDEVLHVPLIIRHPTLKAKRIEGLAQIIDVTPTLLDMLGIPLESKFEGLSLAPLIMGREEVNDFVIAGSKFTPGSFNDFFNKETIIQSVRTKEFKLIKEVVLDFNGSFVEESNEFYDLRSDPQELDNIYSEVDQELISKFNEKLQIKKYEAQK